VSLPSQQKQAESKQRSGKIKIKVQEQDNDLPDALEGEVFDDARQVFASFVLMTVNYHSYANAGT
jgi:hypothetical protein